MAACNIPIEQDAVLDSCPDNTEQVLFFNTPNQSTGTSLRNWSTLVSCLSSSFLMVEVGESNAPVDGQSTYQSNSLKNLGGASGRIMMIIDGQIATNFGLNAFFTYNKTTGTVDISPNKWVNGSAIIIPLVNAVTS